MKNYLEQYGTKKVNKFQMGGEMPAEPGMAPAAPQGGGTDLQGMLMQYAESRDPQLAVAICDALLAELGAAQGGGQPMPAAGNGMKMGGYYKNGGRLSYAAPMFKKGGKL
jgi:hypothetical protein